MAAKKTQSKPSSSNGKTSSKNLSFEVSTKGSTSKDNKKNPTRVTIKYDVGFNNALYVRGRGANLSWEKGVPLKNVRADEWVWEPNGSFSHCEFKILINDTCYECGENHHLNNGMKIQYTPNFS